MSKHLVLVPELAPISRRLRAASAAMAVYISLRLLTCLLPFLYLIPGIPSEQDARFGLELAALVIALTLLTSLPYALVLGSLLSGAHESVRRRPSVLVVVAVGALDLASALAIIAFTDGWSSQFRHYWSTALLVPCLALGLRWSLVLAAACIIATNLVLSVTGVNRSGPMDNLLYLQIGWAVSTVVIAGVIGFLGDVVFELQRSRHRAQAAIDRLETMLEITRCTAVITTGLNDLMRRMARAIGERHRCRIVGIYVVEPDGEDVRLAGWLGELEELERHTRQDDNLVAQAVSVMDAQLIHDGERWSAAIPIRDMDAPVGALLIGTERADTDGSRLTGLGNALAGPIAVGIQVARLRQRLDYAATRQEWERITRQIHDRISTTLFTLMMCLETHAEQTKLEGSSVYRRFESMIPSFAQLLIETRQYMYHLLPALRGESGLDRVVESMVAEFQRTSEIPVRLTIGGSAANVPIATTIGLYNILQRRLSDILSSSTATEVEVDLSIEAGYISLSVSDDGVGDTVTGQLDSERQLTGDLGGDIELVSSHGGGTRMVVGLPVETNRGKLDQTGDN